MAGASRVDVTRGQANTPQIPTKAPTYGALVGVAVMGPIGSAFADPTSRDPITSWAAWQAIYGAYSTNATDLPIAAKGFFDEGGKYLYTSRIVHCATPGDPTTKTSASASLTLATAVLAASPGFVQGSQSAPFALTPGTVLAISVDSLGIFDATFNATAASRTSGNGPYVLTDGMVLDVTINGSPVVFTFHTADFATIGAATPAEVAASMNARLAGLNPSVRAVASVSGSAVKLTTTLLGLGASLNVTGGSANAVLGYTTGALAGTGNVQDIAAVTMAEVTTIVQAAAAGAIVTTVFGAAAKISSRTTGGTSIIQIGTIGTTPSAYAAFGFDSAEHTGGSAGSASTLTVSGKWDGVYANALSIAVLAPASGVAGLFDLQVLQAGLVVESWRSCSMDPTSPNYVVTLVNIGSSTQKGSRLIVVADELAAYAVPLNNPATGVFGPLSFGNDGVAGLEDSDYYGSTGGTGGATGLYVFNRISRIDLAAVPGMCTPAVHSELITWAEVYRSGRTFPILAVPSGLSVAQARTYVSTTAALQELSEIASIYGPWIYVDNPQQGVFGTSPTILAPPEGALMGMFCANDASKVGGAFEHPSNARGVLTTARGVETDEYEDDTQRGLAFDTLINAVRAQRGKAIYVDGARCLKSTGPFPTVGQSRGAMLVANALIDAYDDLRNAGIKDDLYVQLATLATVYLGKLCAARCFRTTIAAQAFFVDFGAGLNTPDIAEARQVLGTVGIGAPPPAEFIFVTLVPFAGLAAQFAQAAQQASPGV